MTKFIKIAGITAFVLACGATSSYSARHTVNLSASVEGTCSVSASAPTGMTATSFEALIENGKAKAKTASIQLMYTCTASSLQMILTSQNQGITKSISPVPSGQTNKIHYTSRAIINGAGTVLAEINTNSASTATNTKNFTGTSQSITVEINVPAGSLPLVPGNDYSDSLHIDINPQA